MIECEFTNSRCFAEQFFRSVFNINFLLIINIWFEKIFSFSWSENSKYIAE